MPQLTMAQYRRQTRVLSSIYRAGYMEEAAFIDDINQLLQLVRGHFSEAEVSATHNDVISHMPPPYTYRIS